MSIYPYKFTSDSSLKPKSNKKGSDKMACKKTKKATATKTKKTASKKKPC